MKLPILTLASGLLVLVCGSAPALGGAGDIFDLGTLGGSSSTYSAVNESGQVAGSSATAGDAGLHAFRYDGAPGSGTMRDLGAFDGRYSEGLGINASGQVTGESNRSIEGYSPGAYRYNGTPGSGGTMYNLQIGQPLDPLSFGRGINASGQITGYAGGGNYHAFRYDGTPGVDGVVYDLGTLGGRFSYAYAINDAAQVAGHSWMDDSGDTVHAFRYDGTPGAGGIMRDLGTLGGDNSYGDGINSSGQVVGDSQTDSNAADRAYRYDGTPGAGGVMHELAILPGGNNSAANAITDAGYIVGNADQSDTNYVAALWRPDGSIVNLDSWLDLVNPAVGALWTLTSASDISENGWIVGAGLYDADGDGPNPAVGYPYLLDASSLVVPEPFCTGEIAFAIALLSRRKRR